MQVTVSVADSRREMLAKRRQSGSMTVTVDDTESAADAPMPTGNQRRTSPAASARHHCSRTTHLPASTASSRVAAAAPRRRLHAAGRSATATRPVRTSPQQSGDGGPAPQRRFIREILDVF